MIDPQVTIVVTPRERFSYAKRSLANLYEQTTSPFKLVYVSAGTPRPLRHHLEGEAQRRGFQLIQTEHYLSPNTARNLGLREVHTKYVVFLDNDALVTPGWLDALVQCAEETDAWIVGPLYLIGEPERQIIHMAGGTVRLEQSQGKRILYDEPYLFDMPLAELSTPLQRQSCGYTEFHCMLVRTDVFARVGPLDEELRNHHEHIDICLAVHNAGGSVFIEPQAVTSYVPPPPCEWWDLPYFMLRWSETWNQATVHHFNKKWGVSTVRFFTDTSPLDQEDTIVRWARGHRRLMTGLRVPLVGTDHQPKLPIEQAQLMIAMFLSVDRDCFDLTLTTAEGSTIRSELALDPPSVLERVLCMLPEADEGNLNVMIHPRSQGQSHEPILIRIDDLDAEGLSKMRPYAFLAVETRPQHYQCWLAVARSNWRDTAVLRNLTTGVEAHGGTNGYTCLAGSKNIAYAYQQADGSFPRVKLVEGCTGMLNTVRQLEGKGVLASFSHSHINYL